MKLEIDYKKITDAPYKKDTDSFFSFTNTEVKDVVNLISKMSESSYYLSGYRGVGKTSFIKKVEEELTKIDGFIFIHVSVAKYDKYEIVIRSFIRQFYIQFVENGMFKSEALKKNLEVGKLADSLRQLNKETFSSFNIERAAIKKVIKEKEITLVNYKEEILFFIAALLTVFLITIDFKTREIYKLIAQIISVGVTITQGIKLGYTIRKTITSSNQHKETEKNLYDDEIAEHRFTSLLKDFKSVGIKPVFIIDELDKLPIRDAKNILYLFKSTLLSGHANFIVVGGQDLYYELYSANDCEDHILSTLFSKTVHIQLKSSYELRDLFEKLVLNKDVIKTEDQRTAYDQYVNWLILDSKKISRKFVNLIKNQLSFENDKAFVDVPEEYNKPANTELLAAIDKACSHISNHPDPIKDYIIMNLFTEAEKLLHFRKRDELNFYINNLE